MYGDLLVLNNKVYYDHCVMRITEQCAKYGGCPAGYMSQQCDKYKLVLLEDDTEEMQELGLKDLYDKAKKYYNDRNTMDYVRGADDYEIYY